MADRKSTSWRPAGRRRFESPPKGLHTESAADMDSHVSAYAGRILARVTARGERGRPMALKKILVVEDNEDNRRILVYRLKKIGQFDIREATNGQEAIDAVKADPPDLVFMDLKMPVMDGWEATKRIREMEGGSAVRIIALTAQAMAGDEEKALAIGCDDYLAKPVVDPSLVRQKLERLIGAAA